MLTLSFAAGSLAQQHLLTSSGQLHHYWLHAKLKRGGIVLLVLHARAHYFAPPQAVSRQHMYMEAQLLLFGAGWQRPWQTF